MQGDLLEPLWHSGLAGQVEAVVCNPPYVSESEYEQGEPELKFEPREAIVAGESGLEVYEKLLPDLGKLPNLRFAAVEVGYGQAEAVAEMMGEVLRRAAVASVKDLGGVGRVVIGAAAEAWLEAVPVARRYR